jgi:hypothetical protein
MYVLFCMISVPSWGATMLTVEDTGDPTSPKKGFDEIVGLFLEKASPVLRADKLRGRGNISKIR